MSFKEQLRDEVLPKMAEYYNEGSDINSAIVKAASDFNLNLEQTYRLVEAANTARTIAHFTKHADDRTQNFDIADKDTVRRMLYEPKQEKSASADADEFRDYSAYDEPERDYTKDDDFSMLEKEAAAVSASDGVKGFTEAQIVEQVVKYADDCAARRDFAKDAVEAVRTSLEMDTMKLAESLSSGYEPERTYAMFKVAMAGKCPTVMKNLDRCISDSMRKEAAPHVKAFERLNVFDASEVDRFVKKAEELESDAAKLAEARKSVSLWAGKEAEARAKIRKYASLKLAQSADGKDKDKDRDKKPKDRDKGGPWMSKAVNFMIPSSPPGTNQIANYLVGGALDQEKIDKAVFPVEKKKTDLKEYIDNLRRSDLLNDLYANDPILSEQDPNDVMKAYQTIVEASPEMSLNKELVRAVLRQSVNSVAVSPFDAKQWADLDKVLKQNKAGYGAERYSPKL